MTIFDPPRVVSCLTICSVAAPVKYLLIHFLFRSSTESRESLTSYFEVRFHDQERSTKAKKSCGNPITCGPRRLPQMKWTMNGMYSGFQRSHSGS